MSDLKATPGPWVRCKVRDWSSQVTVCGADGFVVARIEISRFGVGHRLTEAVEANAHLIAAAPALYEALELALYAIEGNIPNEEAWAKARPALRLARGETP